MADQEGLIPLRFYGGKDANFTGIDQEQDPGSVPPQQCVDLVNVEVLGPKIIDRPGQLRATSGGALDAEVYGMWDLESYLE